MLPLTLFAPVLLLALVAARLVGKAPRRHPRRWAWGCLLVWVGFYTIYFQRMGW